MYTSVQTSISRRVRRPGRLTPLMSVASLALVGVTLLLAACGGAAAPSAADLLKTARQKLDATQTLHFVMLVDHAGTGSIEDPYPTGAIGDVQRPDHLKASADVNVGLGGIKVNIVLIGDQGWYDPGTGQYQTTDQFGSFLRVFDKQTGISSLLGALQQPSAPADGSANGTACWKVSGTLPGTAVKQLFSDASGDAIPATFCMSKDDGRLLSAQLSGKLVVGDTDKTVHTFFLSDFDKPVSNSSADDVRNH